METSWDESGGEIIRKGVNLRFPPSRTPLFPQKLRSSTGARETQCFARFFIAVRRPVCVFFFL